MAYSLAVATAALAICLASCLPSAEVRGTLRIDGKTVVPTGCASGQPEDFYGVILYAGAGQIRLVQQPGGTATVYFAPADSEAAFAFSGCVSLTLTPESDSVDVNGRMAVLLDGTASLSCLTGPHTASGLLSFQACGL
jgi:hypothetical protein